MRVREDEIVLPDGSAGIYGVVDKPDFALVIPLERDHVWLVEQFRYPVGRRCWEFPQGSSEDEPASSPVELARAELREETGLAAGELRHVGHLHHAPGFCSQGFDAWLATGLEPGPTAREPGEQTMSCHRVPIARWEAMVRSGQVLDAPSIAAWALLRLGGPELRVGDD
jgi:8-oxo-dGTP pyrophosphatase MutT (NUDIX family)